METKFNHEQSLALIGEMIIMARSNVQKERTYPWVYWGCVVAMVAMANFVLMHTLDNPNVSFAVWLLMVPSAAVSYFIDRRIDRSSLVKTHIDKIGSAVWNGFGIGIVVFLTVIYTVAHKLDAPQILILINPVILGMVGTGQFTSACVYRFKPWYWIAALFWLGAAACAFSRQDVQFLILAVCMIGGYVIPGCMLLRKMASKDV
jgi:hypothetical protein